MITKLVDEAAIRVPQSANICRLDPSCHRSSGVDGRREHKQPRGPMLRGGMRNKNRGQNQNQRYEADVRTKAGSSANCGSTIGPQADIAAAALVHGVLTPHTILPSERCIAIWQEHV